jgi:hypothetical protein
MLHARMMAFAIAFGSSGRGYLGRSRVRKTVVT